MSEPIAGEPSKSPLSQFGDLYVRLCQADRDVESDRQKNPLLAGLLSAICPGLGQLYNRQLIRAAWWAVILLATLLLWGVTSLAGWWPFDASIEGWRGSVGVFLDRIAIAFPIVSCGLWVTGIVDAFRVAMALRMGRRFVRFSFRKQAALLAAGVIPVAGSLTPDETCTREELNPDLRSLLTEKAITRLVAGKVRRLLMVAVIVLGLIPIIAGGLIASQGLVIAGAIVVLAALLVVLIW